MTKIDLRPHYAFAYQKLTNSGKLSLSKNICQGNRILMVTIPIGYKCLRMGSGSATRKLQIE
jgi:hypothetical protein